MPTTRSCRLLLLSAFCLIPALTRGAENEAADADADANASPHWIWAGSETKGDQTVYFRKEFVVKGPVLGTKLVATCDNVMTLYLNGEKIATSSSWETPTFAEVTDKIKRGRNVLAVEAKNAGGSAGLLVRLVLEHRRDPIPTVLTDASWRASESAGKGWQSVDFKAEGWAPARVVANLGGGPWAKVDEKVLDAAAKRREPEATPIGRLKVAKGFKVERLYSVPKDAQGSWVNMAVDPRGRLIVSDQYGKLYRVTPPPIGSNSKEKEKEENATKVEPIDVEIGEAQGLLWAFDSLYVVVNTGGKFKSGLYRVRDTNNDDDLDQVEQLQAITGSGEHGPHGIVLAPDGKSLYVVAGNATRPIAIEGSLVPKPYDEDQLLPREPDGRGFMKNETAPGGCVYRVDSHGKRWELVSMGYRNPFDLAFNRDGLALFTYDSDMEWDINLPWYRPTRVCQVDSGSDFGYRGGSGKWPTYYPDSLPPTINVGPGSPTGIAFGYGAKFPAKYQDALFICDWSYGKLYSVFLKPEGSSYSAVLEEFISGTPLPLTDLVVNPNDGALYFAIGGRRTTSGLYRVTYDGPDSTAKAGPDERGANERTLRHRLEAFHGHADPKAVEAAWPSLGHDDRFIRYAARVAVEFQDPAAWQDRALAETDTQAALTALLALARMGDKALQPRLLERLDRIEWSSLSTSQKLELLRVYDLTFIRMGTPGTDAADRTIARFDPQYPSKSRELNAELCKLLIYLQAPDAASKTIALLETAPTQEEQIEYAIALRVLKTGWTMDLRKAYFSWFLKAAHYKGGASFDLFVQHIREQALKGLSESEKEELKSILDRKPEPVPQVKIAADRPFVKSWKLDDLANVADRKLIGRDFDRGRTLFSTVGCFACHRYNNEGGIVGPDLTVAAGRFSARDLLESIITPSKEISDQYGAVVIATSDGRVVTGRIANLNGDNIQVMTDMLNPGNFTGVNQNQIEEMKPSTVSMMPEGLLNTLNQEEILDLLAYLLSRGRREDPMFQGSD